MTDLTPTETGTLLEAVDDVRRAQASVAQVLRELGEVPPFVTLARSEARHLATLEALAAQHDVLLPPDPWPARTPSGQTFAAACAETLREEDARADLHERLLDSTHRADLLTAFRHLQRASVEEHLPALRRALARSRTAPPPGQRCG